MISSVAGSGTSWGGGGGHSGSFVGSQGGGGPGGMTPPGGMNPGMSSGGISGGDQLFAGGGKTGVGVTDGDGAPGVEGTRPGSRGTGV